MSSLTIYAIFMIGYLLFLTLLLPSISAYEPGWINVGSYAEYSVEEYAWINLVENGTYTWRIISTHTDVNGELIARINETYALEWKEDGWFSWWANNISPTGRIIEINVKDGIIDSSPLWFNQYYNDYLIDLSDFKIGNETFEGKSLEEVSIQGETRLCVRLTRYIPTYYRVDGYWFDRENGLLLKYTYSFRDRGTQMILKSTNISSEAHNGKAIMDLLLVSPLFIVPVAGAATGLLIIKQRRYRFSRRFLFLFTLFNGIILACVANWPFRTPLGRLHLGYFYDQPVIIMMMLNAFFWIGVLTVAIFLIDRFAFPIILHEKQ